MGDEAKSLEPVMKEGMRMLSKRVPFVVQRKQFGSAEEGRYISTQTNRR